MVLGTIIRWGIPLSYVYCTIWQQNIWREGDEQLIAEQKRTWKNFFGLIDCGYYHLASRLSMTQPETPVPRLNLVGKIESMNLSRCWNSKVVKFFGSIDKAAAPKSVDISELTKSIGLTK